MIGIFDSGSGGLTVLKAIREVLPSCDVLYFGDIKNAPYGSRSQQELSLLTARALRLLRERGAARIVSACNSTSASLVVSLLDLFELAPAQLIEMVGPTVAYTKDFPERLALCATPATVSSGIYQNAFAMAGKEVRVIPVPDLAGAIEFGESEDRQREYIEAAFADVPRDFEALILGCTHYPLALDLFKKALPGKVIFDPAIAVAERVSKLFWPQEVGEGTTRFLISKESPHFRTLILKLFGGSEYSIEVVE